ncbi:hypothetical protein B0T24DRAFT_553266 [Lasiosphaeria ovina]|uniref:Uncharacterized protein n=1 Tax=Lasiosphaeria ovina TaxID=92902 RepID=A0AAE0N832_9PEZI|nr:hypothetical protein B0T24DRAFT_553266 [Lasiosphaeria ovina]
MSAPGPQTPRHSPHPSLEFQSPASYSPQERRQSKTSLHDPSTPLRNSFNNPESLDMAVFSSGGFSGGGGGGSGNGLGNLADELAGAFSDGEGDDIDDDDYYGDDRGSAPPDISFDLDDSPEQQGHDEKEAGILIRDSGVDVESTGSQPGGARGQRNRASLSLPSPVNGRGHRRAPSEYDGSEYGSESDLESPGMPPKLVEKMGEVESLARRGTESNGSSTDGVFQRVTDGLRDLGSQSGVEGGATRLITAHSALTTHMSHQTRQLHNLTFPLLSPLVAPPDADTVDELLPMLMSLSDCMPRPSTGAFNSLASLHAITADLVQTLNYLSDTLHMSRQTTTTATRRLKSARDLVAEMKRDDELRDEGERWIARGNWGDRLQRRECAGVCGDVVGGFEEVCDAWRKRLQAQAEPPLSAPPPPAEQAA